MDEIGPSNVLQIVTINAPNSKLAEKEIEKVHKHIFWSPCVAHTFNLIFKDFDAKFSWMQETYKKGKEIVNFFINHSQPLAMFRTHSELVLLKVTKTRFASHFTLLRRKNKCREAPATTMVLMAWKDWIKNNEVGLRLLVTDIVATIQDEHFWE